MPSIRVTGMPGSMGLTLDQVAAFPGASFGASIPEAIGNSAAPYWFGSIKPTWGVGAAGELTSSGEQPGELDYTAHFASTEDTVDIRIRVTNRSRTPWAQSLAFNCFSPIGVPDVRDHECLRHWVGVRGKPTLLRSLPRRFGPRPAIQLYPIEGGPGWRDIPFVRNFACSPDDVALEPWMAVVAPDGQRLVAAVSKPGLFLFQNREYSCIHCGPSFGALQPGETGWGLTRLYLVKQPLADWYTRMKREMAEIQAAP